MKAIDLIHAFEKANKRTYLLGNLTAGVVIALDMEGRIYTILEGEVMNRVNLDAIAGQSTRELYLNPGGDGLWPAPEGTTMGYNYSSGNWRVSPGLTGAKYLVKNSAENKVVVEAEIDLINSQGIGIPTVFRRVVQIIPEHKSILVQTEETIKYLGSGTLTEKNCLLAPWSLCQFDCGPGCEVIFPCEKEDYVWDLYDDKIGECGEFSGNIYKAIANGSRRYQIGIGEQVPWIELHIPDRSLVIRREAKAIPEGFQYIDISDASPEIKPGMKGIRYSVYSDPSNFMEIEAVGGFPGQLIPGSELSVYIHTNFQKK